MKWKYLYFALNAKDQQLCFYENEKRVKPKGLVDLSYTYLYPVHDSLFERPFCFQLVERTIPCISTYYYLSAESAESALVRITLSCNIIYNDCDRRRDNFLAEKMLQYKT